MIKERIWVKSTKLMEDKNQMLYLEPVLRLKVKMMGRTLLLGDIRSSLLEANHNYFSVFKQKFKGGGRNC